ncbi:DUF4403 family protein [Sphingomonas metalli]|jgi:hypothetical protein|uniref:DUF4403 family protein n=1 Tax=Sphingomonas metalli TaxID=1779358 RepID=UPI001E4B6DCB|nr:DUF4403 family protein [Sphingomonas metalli]
MKNTTARATFSRPVGAIAEAAGQIAGALLRGDELSSVLIVSGLLCVACLSGCDRTPREAPPRATDTISVPAQTSTIDVPIVADLGKLAATLERAVPRRLWSIDKPGQTCLPPKKVKILFAKTKTPAIQCRITGTVVRGPLVLEGSGKTIIVTMPLHAAISARDVGGVLSRETAQADARVRAAIRLDIARDWSPRGTVSIAYDWTDEPHVDFLGQRIEFTSKADAKLAGVVARLERTLPQELAKLQLREQVAQVWGAAFSSVQLNRANPPVWMRITPRQLSYGGYTISRNRVTLALGLTAGTETFVGDRPPDPQRQPLPDMTRTQPGPSRILFAIPVIADYRQLEPVLAKALVKRSRRAFEVPGVGAVRAQFHQVTIYGTTGGKIAVGLRFSAAADGGEPSRGTIWLTATPRNAVNDRRVAFDDLTVAGVTDSVRTSLLLKLANAPGISSTVSAALTQNFEKDFDKLFGKITRAIDEKRIGNVVVRAHITDVRTGQLKAAGQGVYLPVWGRGTATISLAPR